MDGKAERFQARLAGLFYIGTIGCGMFAEAVVRAALIVPGNGRETMRNIADYPWLYRAGGASDVAMLCCYLAVTALLYGLFAPTGRVLARIAALFSLTGIAVLAGNILLHLLPLALIDGAPHPGIPMAEVQSLVRISLSLHNDLYGISLIFFGIYCLLIGWLAIRSRRLPVAVGALLMAGGAVHLVARSLALLSPAIGEAIPGQLDFVPLLGEGAFAIWLLLFGAPRPAAPEVSP